MKSIAELRLAADQKRSDFFENMAGIKTKLRPDYVFDEALRIVDPNFAILKRMENQAKSNPLALLVAVSGLYLLVRQLMTRSANQPPKTPKRGRRSRLARSTSKGDDHGDFDSAERN
jgi:hypothetical protein